ncbi:MAG: HAD family hydrolase [Candidatus Thorarchaeota archaeon]|nr:HAD family hydrolase [Candidatus Thorarchaeota archaeon]
MTKKLRCNAIIFDFDGTLADSMPFLANIGIQIMMKHYDVNRDEAAERYKSTTGLPYEHQIALNFPSYEQNGRAIEEFEKLKIERIFEQRLFPDVVETLTKLNEMHISVFVSSSTYQPIIAEYFAKRKLSTCFAEVVGYRPGFEKGKHHFEHIKTEHGIQLSDSLFVGDSLKDYERSKGYCRFVGLEGMFKEGDFLRAGHEGPVIQQVSELLSMIEPL